MLEHLGGGDQIELRRRRMTSDSTRHRRETAGSGGRRVRPLGLELGILQVDADTRARRRARVAPTARSEHPRRSRRRAPTGAACREQLVERSLESPPSAGGRPGWWSRTCRTCCRSGRRGRRSYEPLPRRILDAASRSGAGRVGARATAPGRAGSSPEPLGPGGRGSRSATASTPSCSSIRRTRSKVRCDNVRWAASRSPITPSAPSSIAALNRTPPAISDWMWPVALVEGSLDEQDQETHEQGQRQSFPSTERLRSRTLFSGSYWE